MEGAKCVTQHSRIGATSWQEAIIGETASNVQFGEGDDAKNIFDLTGGQYGEEVYNFGKELAKLPRTAGRYAVRRKK